MKFGERVRLFLAALAFALAATPAAAVAQRSSLPGIRERIETRMDLRSANTGRTYRIRVFRPGGPPPSGGWPVLYALDGDVVFRQLADQMWARSYSDLRPAVVVGIGYPTEDFATAGRLRLYDLTPAPPIADVKPIFDDFVRMLGGGDAPMGGGERFTRFLVEELRPKLSASFPIDQGDQTLFGHSLGGLMALHILLNRPDAFSTYVAASPSIWYNAGAVIADEPKLRRTLATGALRARLLLTVGDGENAPSSAQLAALPPDEMARQVRNGRGVDNVLEMAARLKELGGGLEVATIVFIDENHVSVLPAALSRALTFTYSRPIGLAGK